jgi:hypothetical protein
VEAITSQVTLQSISLLSSKLTIDDVERIMSIPTLSSMTIILERLAIIAEMAKSLATVKKRLNHLHLINGMPHFPNTVYVSTLVAISQQVDHVTLEKISVIWDNTTHYHVQLEQAAVLSRCSNILHWTPGANKTHKCTKLTYT